MKHGKLVPLVFPLVHCFVVVVLFTGVAYTVVVVLHLYKSYLHSLFIHPVQFSQHKDNFIIKLRCLPGVF